jgi:hypothetical protein
MTQHRQLWLVRLMSIPLLLLLPIMCIAVAAITIGFPRGDSFPTATFVGLLAALIAVVPIARRTLFASAERLAQAKRMLAVLALGYVLVFVLGHLVTYVTG